MEKENKVQLVLHGMNSSDFLNAQRPIGNWHAPGECIDFSDWV